MKSLNFENMLMFFAIAQSNFHINFIQLNDSQAFQKSKLTF